MFDILIWIIGIVSTILGVMQGIPWLLGKRPKAFGKCLYSYIDCERKALVEEREYEFSWGWILFLRTIFLQNISNDTVCKLSYKPTAGPKKTLPEDCYVFEKAASRNGIKLLKSQYFKKREIERVYVLSKTPIRESSYANNIEVRYGRNSIEIVNNNEIEIRNYALELPQNIALDETSRYLSIISGLIIPDLDDESSNSIKIRIKKLDGKRGDEPFIMTIPLHP